MLRGVHIIYQVPLGFHNFLPLPLPIFCFWLECSLSSAFPPWGCVLNAMQSVCKAHIILLEVISPFVGNFIAPGRSPCFMRLWPLRTGTRQCHSCLHALSWLEYIWVGKPNKSVELSSLVQTFSTLSASMLPFCKYLYYGVPLVSWIRK